MEGLKLELTMGALELARLLPEILPAHFIPDGYHIEGSYYKMYEHQFVINFLADEDAGKSPRQDSYPPAI